MTSYVFQEQNLDLPTAGAVRDEAIRSDYQFMEQNLYLPRSLAVTAPDWRLLEANSWGELFVFATSSGDSLFPSPDDVPRQRTGEIAY